MTRFEDFKRDCLSNGSVTCDWDTLHEYLVDHTVADNWWVMTREQRYNIAKAIHRDIPLYTKYRYGLKNCSGGTTEKYQTVCFHAAQYLYMRLNGEIDGDNMSAFYYSNPDSDGEYCLGQESYKLPVYFVSTTMGTTYDHAINAILIDQDYKDVNNWVFFEAPRMFFDLKPPQRMRGGDPCRAARIIKDYHCIEKDYGSYVSQILKGDSEYVMFPIDKDNNFREPGKRTIHIETEPTGLKAIIDSTLKFERVEKITPCNIELSMGVVSVAIHDLDYPHFTISGDLHVGEEYLRFGSPYCKSIINTERGIICEYDHDKYGYYPVTLSMEVIGENFHDTSLSISIINEDGNSITEAYVGDTVYVVGTLQDAETNELLQNAKITLYRNGTNTNLTNMTDVNGEYSIPYTVTKEDCPSVTFKTKFAGGEI